MKKAALFIFTLFLCLLATGQTVKETRNIRDFTGISYGISGTLNVRIGPEFSVVLEGDKDDLEVILTDVSNGRLRIRMENWRFRINNKVNAYVTLPELEGLSVSGSGRAEILDPLKNADDLSLSVSGSGKLYTKEIVADELDCSISGSGDIIVSGSGSVDRGDISISGSGNYSGPELEIDHLEVSVSGSGSCTCKAGDSLNARISGSGNVTYSGNPRIDARVSGSGKVRSSR
ncbi:MAG TPA: head GIN domain-containing protein [Bacteroidales bacterium]|nr:head GIN domain-containing protein [Bacteroidales bacterium]HPF04041.1 head GIN domain-containing protein [Bacteroidales bacterium]HPR11403.1 head GIN domain-containing protein [Bacteroidales bacterium]HRW85281.1 head GIN domain-containing protein [Bacteroidales bacterium]